MAIASDLDVRELLSISVCNDPDHVVGFSWWLVAVSKGGKRASPTELAAVYGVVMARS